MSNERTDGLEPHGEVVDGLLGLQARLRGDKRVEDRPNANGKESEAPSLSVVHDDLTVRLSEAVSTLQSTEALSALSDRLGKLETLLNDIEQGIGDLEKKLAPARKS